MSADNYLRSAYLGVHRVLDDPGAEKFDHPIVLSRVSADIAQAYKALTGEDVGSALGWDSGRLTDAGYENPRAYDRPTRYVVEFEDELYGPFETEDECYSFAAKVSREPNDWTPRKVHPPPRAGLTQSQVQADIERYGHVAAWR